MSNGNFFKKVILLNLIFIVIFFIITDIILYLMQPLEENLGFEYYKFFNIPEKFSPNTPIYDDGEEFKNKKSIILCGCSFAYSYGLNRNETLSYKLSKYAKRHVFVRAVCSGGPYEALWLLSKDDFYKNIHEPKYVIYLFIENHFSRMNSRIYSLNSPQIRPYYEIDENFDIKEIPCKNQYLYLSHIYKWYYRKKYTLHYQVVEDDKFYKTMCALNKLIKNHWKDTKLIVLRLDEPNREYNNVFDFSNEFIKKLNDQGILYLDANKLVFGNSDKRMLGKEFMQEDQHPSAYAMDIVAKKLAEYINR